MLSSRLRSSPTLDRDWMTTPILDRITAETGALSPSERLSVPDTAFFLAYALGLHWLGDKSDRGDPRVIAAGGLAASSFFLALFGLGYYTRVHPTLFYGCLWFCQAFCQALVWPACVRVTGDWFAGNGTRSVLMGMWCSCNNVGNLLGAAIGALGAAALGPEVWGAPMLALSALLLAVSWLVFLRLTPRPDLVSRAPYSWSVGAKDKDEDELVEELLLAPRLSEEREEVIAFGPASPIVRHGWEEEEADEGGWTLLEPPQEQHHRRVSPGRPGAPITMWRALCLPGVLEVGLSYAALKVRRLVLSVTRSIQSIGGQGGVGRQRHPAHRSSSC